MTTLLYWVSIFWLGITRIKEVVFYMRLNIIRILIYLQYIGGGLLYKAGPPAPTPYFEP